MSKGSREHQFALSCALAAVLGVQNEPVGALTLFSQIMNVTLDYVEDSWSGIHGKTLALLRPRLPPIYQRVPLPLNRTPIRGTHFSGQEHHEVSLGHVLNVISVVE